ncbi:MAG TPA: hypothetical protein VJJ75_00580 [Candidatus Nanoarchaeia archaeon]|nr:hypothetical protein [Candidatus Nanoarchaeia archaeon]
MRNRLITEFVVILSILFVLINSVSAYDVDPPSKTVHQYLTNESKDVWELIPHEINLDLAHKLVIASLEFDRCMRTDGGSCDEYYDTYDIVNLGVVGR